MRTVLSIAGSDCSGGAGIQADLKTMTAFGIYGMTAVTALTAQNTMGVHKILEVPPEFLADQLECIFTDIVPDAVKIGMVCGGEMVEVIAKVLTRYHGRNIVLDPVMVSTSGRRLLSRDGERLLKERLFPLSTLITPNIPEAECLVGWPVRNHKDMENAARTAGESYRTSVLLKGGHCPDGASDVLFHEGRLTWFTGRRVDNPNTHGTGCTLSSAIACGLAKGCSLEESIDQAKKYLTRALDDGLQLGHGNGPLNHIISII